MNLVHKYTNDLRSRYLTDFKRLAIQLGAGLISFILIAVVFDIVAPFESLWNIARAFLVIIGAFYIFSVGYVISFMVFLSQRARDDSYVPVKERFSPAWRVRLSVIVGAILFAMILASNKGAVYTLTSALIVAAGGAIVLFVTRTPEESEREFFGIPDKRDNAYNEALSDIRAKRAKAAEKAKKAATPRLFAQRKKASDTLKDTISQEKTKDKDKAHE